VHRPPLAVLSVGLLLSAAMPFVAFGRDRGPLRPSEVDAAEQEPTEEPAAEDEQEPAPDDEGDADEGNDDADETNSAPSGLVRAGDDAYLSHADAGRRRPTAGCPHTMTRSGEICIDRYEAPNRRGARPLVMQSANDANAWCSAHHKRLCTEDEWIAACEGEEHRAYPYAGDHVDGRCNDDKPWRAVDEPLLAKWPAPEAKMHAKELYQGAPSGSKRKCVSSVGARDMTGNVEEWVVRTRDHTNDWPYILIGCYWSGCYGGNKPTCHSTNSAHGPDFRFYETGFRCCQDVNGGP